MNLLERLANQGEDMIDMLETLVMLDSPSSNPEAVDAVGAELAAAFGQVGADVERLPQEHFGDHLRVSWGQGNRQIL